MNVTLLSTILMQLHSQPPTRLPSMQERLNRTESPLISPTRALMGSLVPHPLSMRPLNQTRPRLTGNKPLSTGLGADAVKPTTVFSPPVLDTHEVFTASAQASSSFYTSTPATTTGSVVPYESNTIHDEEGDNEAALAMETTTVHWDYEHGRVPPSYSRDHRKHKPAPTLQHRKRPYFRPPGAISKKHRQVQGSGETWDPNCFPRCTNYTNAQSGSRRHRKHSQTEKTFYNYKLLHDTVKHGSGNKQKTEFYAWIFGATMLTLGSLTTLTSCFAFCFCSDKWRKRRKTKKFDDSGEYQRVDSVSSMVDSHVGSQADYEPLEPLDDVTII